MSSYVEEEILEYINNPETNGVLLLTGDWGCGKTYLIDNNIIKNNKDSYYFIKCSLFGIDKIEAVDLLLKKKWALISDKEYIENKLIKKL